MRRMFKAHVKIGTNLEGITRKIKEALKDDLSVQGGHLYDQHGIILERSEEFSQKVKITIIVERVKA